MSEADRLEAAVAECREMIREAHAATKDLRAAVRDAKRELQDLAKDEVAAQVQREVSRQLRSWANGPLSHECGNEKVSPSSTGSVSRCWARRPTGRRRAAGVRPDAPTPMW